VRVWGGRRPTGPWASCTVPLLELAVVSWEGKAERMAWKLARAMGSTRHCLDVDVDVDPPLAGAHQRRLPAVPVPSRRQLLATLHHTA
jgi:hypothetical protein